jgi:CHAT domain-containing protein/Tfp pilus assembly protein PilF
MRFFILLCFLSFAAHAQKETISSIEKADNLLLDSKFDEAVGFIDHELQVATVTNDQRVILENKKAEALVRLGKLSEAETVLNGLTTKYPAASSNDFLLAITDNTNGILRLNQGRPDLAEELLKRSISKFEAAGKSNELEAAQALANLGIVYMSLGKYSQAEEQQRMALTLRENKLKGSHELIAATYNDLGLVYLQSDKDKALDYYEKALAIYKQLHGNEHNKIAIANINIGIAYRDLELYGDAVNNFETALKIWEKIYTQPHPAKAIALYNLGQTYLKMGNLQATQGYYNRALKMYLESYGDKHPEVVTVLHAIGNLQLSERKYDAALKTYQQSLKANVQGFNSDDIAQNPPVKNFYHGIRLLRSLLFKAQALENRYTGKSLRFNDLKSCLNTLHSCDTLIDLLRQQSTNESDKIQLGVIANEVYGDGVRVAHEAAMNSFKKKSYLETAFYFAEKSKSAVLLEAIADANAKSFAGIPPELLEEERGLKSAIALTAQKLAQKPSAEEEKYLRETSFNLKRSYEAFTKQLEKQFPDYFNLKFNASSPAIKELQGLLSAETALISYFIDESKNRLYIFEITKKKYTVTERAIPAEFDKYITGLRNGLFFNEQKTYSISAQKLYSLLIPKMPGSVKELVILPTGRLGIIPFEALLSSDPKTTDYSAFPYLLNRFTIRYEFSAGLIQQKSKLPSAQTAPCIFLCAPVVFPAKDRLGDLPGTEREVNDIAQLFAAKNFRSERYIKSQADEKVIKSDALNQYNLIHFATHGIVDEKNPELSRVFLQSNSEAEDGNLFAGEIYNLKLKANLVTLSACQTGLGKISKGEGVIGLSRALVYAGAKNIIVSFWSVADESTAELMKDFYAQLLQREYANFGADLRNAKLGLIHGKKYSAPYYWAPFILIGF